MLLFLFLERVKDGEGGLYLPTTESLLDKVTFIEVNSRECAIISISCMFMGYLSCDHDT